MDPDPLMRMCDDTYVCRREGKRIKDENEKNQSLCHGAMFVFGSVLGQN